MHARAAYTFDIAMNLCTTFPRQYKKDKMDNSWSMAPAFQLKAGQLFFLE